MNKDYLYKIKKQCPWFFDLESKFNIILTDDLDSLFSYILIKNYRPNWDVSYFYDFKEGLYKKIGINEDFSLVGIDLSHPSMKCISNHVTRIRPGDAVNPNEINLNNIDGVSVNNYHSKYSGSTFLLCCGLLGHKLKTREQAVISLLFDSAFLPFYANPDYQDAAVQKHYLCDVLELPEVYEFQKTMTKARFIECQEVLETKTKLWVIDKEIEPYEKVNINLICKYLGLDYNPAWLQGDFGLVKRSESYSGHTSSCVYEKKKIFSFAVINKRSIKYSMLVD